ncbi:MAG TPA: cytochrome c oxidase subunit 3 [Terriglobales bacterium]|nr:cytochrome c oxidase subunit 3 [Terriglobales bacterium]
MSQVDAMAVHSTGHAESSSPFAIPTKKLAMWLFIISDAATFGACLVAYGFLRNGTPNWPTPFKFSPTVINTMAMTFILITSSLTMLLGVRAAKLADKTMALGWVYLTAALGAVFALLHLREWLGMIHEGVRLFQNPWGSGLFGAAFFSVTGLHLLHVTAGVLALVAVGLRYKQGRYHADDIEILGLYWHFVDLVWMFVVPFVYLMNVAR